jgi:hypothetical protein
MTVYIEKRESYIKHVYKYRGLKCFANILINFNIEVFRKYSN